MDGLAFFKKRWKLVSIFQKRAETCKNEPISIVFWVSILFLLKNNTILLI